MQKFTYDAPFDLISPDGYIVEITIDTPTKAHATVKIENISPQFRGFYLDPKQILFNCKSTLGQIGVNATLEYLRLKSESKSAEVRVNITTHGPFAAQLLQVLTPGTFIGKLFAADPERKVRDIDYLQKKFGRTDEFGDPLLSLGGMHKNQSLEVEKVDGRLIAYIPITGEVASYKPDFPAFLNLLNKALTRQTGGTRQLLSLIQMWSKDQQAHLKESDLLLVRTLPLHIRTVFANVVQEKLPKGYTHMAASVLHPTTKASGEVYEFIGKSDEVIKKIPLEFYTLEPHREYSLLHERNSLQEQIANDKAIFSAFDTMPETIEDCSIFTVKGEQLSNLTPGDWIQSTQIMHSLPGLADPEKQAILVNDYIEQQSEYPILKAITQNSITSEGILISKNLPTPLLKQLLINRRVQKLIKGIYFKHPSAHHGIYFSHEDRAFLHDLATFGIPTYWVDDTSNKVLKYCVKADKDSGMFVPIHQVQNFQKATFLGIYGSNLIEGSFESELLALLNGLKELKNHHNHPLLNKSTPLALVTGGGPGMMELGNRVAKKAHILSCANIVDFQSGKSEVVNEQKVNPYIDAKMTFRIDKLVERQAEFHLDLPIFLAGGIGTDFELLLEEVIRKVGATQPLPALLFGPKEYWQNKITTRFRQNLESGTILGSEWISNCFYCVKNSSEGLLVYKKFMSGELQIGKEGPVNDLGFFPVSEM